MTSLTINVSDEIAKGLKEEAAIRHLTPEDVAAERVSSQQRLTNRKPTPSRMPLGTGDPMAAIGAFADRPGLLDSVLEVMEDRARRYSGTP